MSFQPNLSELRNSKSLEQRNVADALKISQSTLSQIENGQITMEFDRAGTLADTLGVPLGEVLQAYRESRRRHAQKPRKSRKAPNSRNKDPASPPAQAA